ncbi:MvdC/MvdD family ATP grasp protein [Streptomyces sp. 4F14]|uniref:MvdC/MvdD family ATP grasp protein n=1 Tax=Streptomyces sp. 4F14 TaxID=3394380 RepID=UPI003A84E3D9
MKKTVLVVDSPHDAGTDLVVERLSTAGVPVFRFDTREFPRELSVRAILDDGEWTGSLETSCRRVGLSDVGAVYWNRPQLFEFPDLSEADAHWARGAARIGIGGVLTSLPVPYLNHPAKASAAEFKPVQLRTAHVSGLSTPRTLITCDGSAVREFAAEIGTPMITKPLGSPYITHSAGTESMYTREVSLDALDGVETTAHLFQERVPKAYEVRLTYVGGTCRAVRIDAGSDISRVDWRADYDSLKYSLIEAPTEVTFGVTVYTARLGLEYAAFDFVVRPDGEWVFLEANPSGQWAWLEAQDARIADSISRTLERWCHL